MDWKRGLTYMFLVGRLRNFFKLIFVWIPEVIVIGGLLSLTGMDEDLEMLLFFIIVLPLNLYIFSVYLTNKYVVGNQWAEQELSKTESYDPGMLEDLGKWFTSIIGVVLLVALAIFIIGGVIGLAYFGWQQLL